jgi:hypothetical protein
VSVTQSIFYRVGDLAQTVRLRIVIGQAQKGATVVQLGSGVLASTNDDVVDVELGTGAEVRGKKVFCTTLVTDVNPQTNLTSVSWELSGGAKDFVKTCTESLDRSGDSVLFVAVITCL